MFFLKFSKKNAIVEHRVLLSVERVGRAQLSRFKTPHNLFRLNFIKSKYVCFVIKTFTLMK